MASINDIVKTASNKNWFLTDNFEISIFNKRVPAPTDNFGDTLKTCVMSINIPTLSAAETDVVMGGERKIGVQIFETFKFDIKFRDFNAGQLRRYFEAIFVIQQYEYFDNVKTNVTLWTNDGHLLLNTNDCLITSVGGFSLDNSSTQIAEFDVSFVATKFDDDLLSGFGSEKVASLFNNSVEIDDSNEGENIL